MRIPRKPAVVFLNGRFVPEKQAVISVFDRGFQFGDGLFEAMRVFNGEPFRWNQHIERLQRGADFLKIRLPLGNETLRDFAGELIQKNHMPDSMLRVTLSRGAGPPGYSPRGAARPTLVMSLHPPPGSPSAGPPRSGKRGRNRVQHRIEAISPRWKLITASPRLPAGEPLAQFKTCNKLAQILARAEAESAGADEAILLNTDGFVAEGSSSNVFWIHRGTVCTAPLAGGLLAGVTRAVVQEICASIGVRFREAAIRRGALERQDGIFLSLSSWGIVDAVSLDGRALRSSSLVEKLRLAYWTLVRGETEAGTA